MEKKTKSLIPMLFGAWLGFILAVFGIYWYDWKFYLIIIPANIFFVYGIRKFFRKEGG